MPGNNCAVVGCSACKGRNRGLSFHGLPKRPDLAKKQWKDEVERQEWRRQLIVQLNRADSTFNPDRATICSRHFKAECFTTSATGKKSLNMGSLPTEFMPVSSVNTPRSRKLVVRIPLPPPPPKVMAHRDLDDVRREAKRLEPPWLLTADNQEYIDIGLLSSLQQPYDGFKLNLRIAKNVSVTIHVYGLLMDWIPSVETTKLSKFISDLERRPVCPGVTEPSLQTYAELPKAGCTYFLHIRSASTSGFLSSVRSMKCCLLLDSNKEQSLCSMCRQVLGLLQRKQSRSLAPAGIINPKTPLQKLDKSKLSIALQQSRRHEKLLQSKVARIEKRLKKIKARCTCKSRKRLKVNRSVKLSEKICVDTPILLHYQSSSAHDTLHALHNHNTGVLKLPYD